VDQAAGDALLMAVVPSASSWSQPTAPHPAKPLRFIVPVAAGSSADIAARAIAGELALPHIRTGKLKVIAIISDAPVPRFPGVSAAQATRHLHPARGAVPMLDLTEDLPQRPFQNASAANADGTTHVQRAHRTY
jgi:hypothetical protein